MKGHAETQIRDICVYLRSFLPVFLMTQGLSQPLLNHRPRADTIIGKSHDGRGLASIWEIPDNKVYQVFVETKDQRSS